MRKILVTGGTVFVSRFVASWFLNQGDEVYVLNRGSRLQVPGVKLIRADRHSLGDSLRGLYFDAVLDVTSYTRADVEGLVNGLEGFGDYIFISSSAVYPESNPQPFREEQECGPNKVWGPYGVGKLEAEEFLRERVPRAYILRPPYLYGPGENVHRAPFVFECAEAGRRFYIPGDGEMGLQFFHVEDLCRFMDILLRRHPAERVFNVGNPETVTVRQWAQLCYSAAGAELGTVSVDRAVFQRAYFPFHDYSYRLDVTKQRALMPEVKPLAEGIREEYRWFRDHREEVDRRPYVEYIDRNLAEAGR